MSGLVPDLRKMIDDFQSTFFPKLPKEVIEPLMAGVDELALSGIDRAALRVGAPAPDFELPDADGTPVRLSSLLALGPVVLTFYRGVW
jgi:AhpC/TSA family protein